MKNLSEFRLLIFSISLTASIVPLAGIDWKKTLVPVLIDDYYHSPIRKNSITKKAIRNSFIFSLTLVQLINMHKKINKVVKRIKNSEIPSMPKLKLKFKKGIHNSLLTN